MAAVIVSFYHLTSKNEGFLMKISTMSGIALLFAGVSFGCSAKAACTNISGTYVGNGSGQAIIDASSGATNNNNTGNGVHFVNVSWSVTLTQSGGGVSGNIVSLGSSQPIPVPQYNFTPSTDPNSVAGGTLTFKNWFNGNPTTLFSNGGINTFTLVQSASAGSANFLNTRSCLGVITGSTNLGPATWIITVGDNGSTITLNQIFSNANFQAFTIELHKI
jgi:hypothetical protein